MDKDFDVIIVEPPKDPRFIPAPYEGDDEMLKHLPGQHDQTTHGSWASGEELSAWDPHSPVPGSPRNAGGMTARMWDLWEHGPDGNQYVELYRQYAGEALGIAVPKSPMDIGGWNNFITKPGYGGSSTETARKDAVAILNAIANGKPEQPALYRGMTATDENEKALLDSITNLKPGDTLDMPLVSTTRSLGVAAWYAGDRTSSGEGNVIMKIQPGAKGVALKAENSRYPHDHEVITSGKFEIVSVTTVEAPYWKRGTFEPRILQFRPEYGGTWYELATYGPKKYTVEESKVAYEAVSSGNWESLETPTFKLTDDRRNAGPFKTLSSWEKQEPRQFTVVEVKMVGDHVVQKADSTDYGLTFDALFNKVPFIRNKEDVQKHGNHDQASHGNWATGGLHEGNGYLDSDAHPKYDYESDEGPYLEAYCGPYSNDINGFLRTGENGDYNLEEEIPDYTDAMDNLISQTEAPREMALYRGIGGDGYDTFAGMKVGDVYTDKGYVSTTPDPKQLWEFLPANDGGYKGTVLEITVPKGSQVLSVKKYFEGVSKRYSPADSILDENEHILPRGLKFKVTGIGETRVSSNSQREGNPTDLLIQVEVIG